MNDETIKNGQAIMKNNAENPQQVDGREQSNNWKAVALGGMTGILMGAGAIYADRAHAVTQSDVSTDTNEQPDSDIGGNRMPVAEVDDSLSFSDAFDAARAEIGPGGVFEWHGGIYNTYTEDEWNNMQSEQREEFAQQVKPEVTPDVVPTPSDENPDIAIPAVEDVETVNGVEEIETNNDVTQADDDVHIVGYGEIDGHQAVAFDTTNDGQADVAIIDINDNYELDNEDIIVDNEGHMATIEELQEDVTEEQVEDASQMASMDNPEVAPDMPDYMDNADLQAMI